MLKVETAGLNWLNVLVAGPVALVSVWTRLLVQSSVHRKPAVKSRTAKRMDALCEYCHSDVRPNEILAMMRF